MYAIEKKQWGTWNILPNRFETIYHAQWHIKKFLNDSYTYRVVQATTLEPVG